MKFKTHFLPVIILMAGAFLLQSFSDKPGGDYYKIMLNDRLVAEQYLTQPKELPPLKLNAANSNDRLTIYFSHCGVPGTTRSLRLKDETGKLLKEWTFGNSKSIAIQLEVKNLLTVSGTKGACTLFYSSKEMPSGQLLTKLQFTKPAVAKL